MSAPIAFMVNARLARVPLPGAGQRSLDPLELKVAAGLAERALAAPDQSVGMDLTEVASLIDPPLMTHCAYKVLEVLDRAGVVRICSQIGDLFGIALPDPPERPQE